MAKNVMKLVAFTFRKVKDTDYLTVMTQQRLSDGENELPVADIDNRHNDYKDYANELLSRHFHERDVRFVFPVGTYFRKDGGESIIVSACGVFLEQFPGNAFGINWRALSSNEAAFDILDEDDEIILSDAKKLFSMQLICSEFDTLSPEVKKRLIDILVSKDEVGLISNNLSSYGRISGITSFSDAELKEELVKRTDRNGKRKFFVYNYFRSGQAVDIVVIGSKVSKDANGRVNKVELQIPLIKRKRGVGAGWWGLPGGFIQEKHYLQAGWAPQKDGSGNIQDTDFEQSEFENYRNALKDGKRVVRLAAKEILETKTGIKVEDSTTFYPLFLRDNPRRGTVDSSPVVANTLLTIIGDYEKPPKLTWAEDSNVEMAEWFTITRVLFNEKGEIIKLEDGPIWKDKVCQLNSGKKSPFDLRSNQDETDAFLFGDSLVINYYQGNKLDRQTSLNKWHQTDQRQAIISDDKRETDLFADHKDAIIDALQLIKEKTHTSTILADFMSSNDTFSLGHLKLTYEELIFPEVTVREYLHAKIVANGENNGFLEKPDPNTPAEYVFNMEKFNEFLYRRVSIL